MIGNNSKRFGKRNSWNSNSHRFSIAIEPCGALFKEHFPMHCVRIQDLLEFDVLYDHDTVKAMNKIVIRDRFDTRPVIFVSHQWCRHDIPKKQSKKKKIKTRT